VLGDLLGQIWLKVPGNFKKWQKLNLTFLFWLKKDSRIDFLAFLNSMLFSVQFIKFM
jgi:hypothetical protein